MTARYTAPLQRRIFFSAMRLGDPAGGVIGVAGKSGNEIDEDKNWKKHVFVKCRVLKTGGMLICLCDGGGREGGGGLAVVDERF